MTVNERVWERSERRGGRRGGKYLEGVTDWLNVREKP